MKKIILKNGLIAGVIVTLMMIVSTVMFKNNPNFEGSEIIGFTGMFVAFSFTFIGIKSYRDKENGGVISFGKAFKVGLLIALIASTMYVAVWLVEYYFFFPDFMEKFSAMQIEKVQASGDAAKIAKTTADMAFYAKIYQNPLYIILATYMEVLIIGIPVALISALILKRKSVA